MSKHPLDMAVMHLRVLGSRGTPARLWRSILYVVIFIYSLNKCSAVSGYYTNNFHAVQIYLCCAILLQGV